MPTSTVYIMQKKSNGKYATLESYTSSAIDDYIYSCTATSTQVSGTTAGSGLTLQYSTDEGYQITKVGLSSSAMKDVPNTLTYSSEGVQSDSIYIEIEPLSSNIQINVSANGTTTLATKGTKNDEDIDINVNVPTYITVASESALPTTAEEGTIAIVEGGA